MFAAFMLEENFIRYMLEKNNNEANKVADIILDDLLKNKMYEEYLEI